MRAVRRHRYAFRRLADRDRVDDARRIGLEIDHVDLVVIALPDGKTALVTRDGDHRVSVLVDRRRQCQPTPRIHGGGFRPYGLVVSPKGDVAVFGNQGGGQGDSDQINVIDLKTKRVVEAITVGQTPEGVWMAPDGSHVAVILHNGSHATQEPSGLYRSRPDAHLQSGGNKLTPVTNAKIGPWAQGRWWSNDGKTTWCRAPIEKEIQVFAFDGKEAKLVTGGIQDQWRRRWYLHRVPVADAGETVDGRGHRRARFIGGAVLCFACGAPR